MNDNIDKNEIRRAIDRLQAEHPCNIAYDPIAFVNMEAVNTIKECVDKLARRMAEDTEINIICEFAKLYLEGVRPTILPKQEWIPCSERLPDKGNSAYLATIDYGVTVGVGQRFFFNKEIGWNDDNVIAWMPLPEQYKEGDPK